MAQTKKVSSTPTKTNYIGKKFNKLTITSLYKENGKTYCDCTCECGNNKKHMRFDSVKSGRSKSCGCNNIEQVTKLGKLSKKYNKYDLSGEYGVGYTSKGEEFYFDLEDYEKIKNYCWRINNYGYLVSGSFILHRIVMNLNDSNFVIDHINHNKFDCRKKNLRICTVSQNGMNMLKPSDNKSGCKGVLFHKTINKWKAFIGINNKSIHLGYFDDFNEAVKARKDAEVKYYGEYNCKTEVS